jgi:hypothetical protein
VFSSAPTLPGVGGTPMQLDRATLTLPESTRPAPATAEAVPSDPSLRPYNAAKPAGGSLLKNRR